jgi:uncharacterized protein (TIGR02271 family)
MEVTDMDRDMTNAVPRSGMDVIGADGEKIGEVDAVEADYFVVRKGFFFPEDHYIPFSAISSYDADNRVSLSVTRDQALEQDWATPPITTTGSRDADLDRGVATDTTRDTDIGYVEEEVIPVHEEKITAKTRPVERGEVRIEKDVVEEQRTLEVPVTEEEVEISRRRVDRPVTDAGHAFEEGTIEVPLRGEEVEIEKRARVVEEVDIDKTAREHTEQVSDTVRREEVHIEGDNVDVDPTNRRTRNRNDEGLS